MGDLFVMVITTMCHDAERHRVLFHRDFPNFHVLFKLPAFTKYFTMSMKYLDGSDLGRDTAV